MSLAVNSETAINTLERFIERGIHIFFLNIVLAKLYLFFI